MTPIIDAFKSQNIYLKRYNTEGKHQYATRTGEDALDFHRVLIHFLPMKRIITRRRLREYAKEYPGARPALAHWEKTTLAAEWGNPSDLKRTFNDVDIASVGSGNTVYVFNIAGNQHRLIAAIHFNTGLVFILRIMSHREYDRDQWKAEL